MFGLGGAYLLAGCALIAAGSWGSSWLAPERRLWGEMGHWLLAGAGIALLGTGAATLRWRRTEAAVNLNLFAGSLLLVSPLLAEVTLRGAIALGAEKVCRPGLYADPLSDDLYYQLERLWMSGVTTVAGRFDPVLGWSPPVTDNNPLGLMEDRPYVPDFEAPSILFYGDSYSAGASVLEPDRIPQILDQMTPHLRVYNFGVGGYGLDQIYLRFSATHALFQRPFLIFGLLTTDLDRSILTFRTGPKPYFVVRDGELILRGAPMVAGSPEWQARFEPGVRSYAWEMLRRSWHRWRDAGDPWESVARREEKLAVNGAILDRLIREARESGSDILFVIFSANLGQGPPGWREAFLERELGARQVPFIDTRVLLEGEERGRSRPVESYILDDGHLNAAGNRVVAGAIARLLVERGVAAAAP
jgi:hypothetical protein